MKRAAVLILILALGAGMFGCRQDRPEDTSTAPARSTDSIMDITGGGETKEPGVPTAVYATAFGDTVYLSTMPMGGLEGEAPLCQPREVSHGGRIHCGQVHEGDEPVVRKVVITEELRPKSTAHWFQGMESLVQIQGLEKLDMSLVTDMTEMFSGCAVLSSLDADGWDVSQVTTMTGIFDGCEALAEKPAWYDED